MLVLGFAVIAAGLVAYGAARRGGGPQLAQPERLTAETLDTAAPEPSALSASAVDTAGAAEPAPEERITLAQAGPRVERTLPSAQPPAAASSTETAASPAASASSAPAPTPEQLRAAVEATPIVVFTASWCNVCRTAHAFLQANHLHWTDRDIDADPSALRELETRTGRAAVPTIVVDGQQLEPGFSPHAVEGAIASSVERRLGVEGVDIETSP